MLLEVSEVGDLSDNMEKLSTGVQGKDEKIKILGVKSVY